MKASKFIVISLVLAMSQSGLAALKDKNPKLTDKVLSAIEFQESSYRTGLRVIDSNGRASYGSMQIQKPYLDDVNRIYKTSYTLEQVRTDKKLAREVVVKYISYYGNHASRKLNRELSLRELISLHNGGPKGYTKNAALSYADKVLSKIRNT